VNCDRIVKTSAGLSSEFLTLENFVVKFGSSGSPRSDKRFVGSSVTREQLKNRCLLSATYVHNGRQDQLSPHNYESTDGL
jgi:hypothetical protein